MPTFSTATREDDNGEVCRNVSNNNYQRNGQTRKQEQHECVSTVHVRVHARMVFELKIIFPFFLNKLDSVYACMCAYTAQFIIMG